MERQNRNRNTAYMLVATGIFLLLGNLIGYFYLAGLIIVFLGIMRLRIGTGSKLGYFLIALGGLVFLSNGLKSLLLFAILFAIMYYASTHLYSPRKLSGDTIAADGSWKRTFIESIRWNRDQWILNNMYRQSFISEVRMDLSLAIYEEKETTIHLQGVIGDVEIIVPEDIGVAVDSTLTIGQTEMESLSDSGLMNKTVWQSPHFDSCTYKVRFHISYLIGDVKVKVI